MQPPIIVGILTDFQRGRITLEEATNRLLSESRSAKRAESDERLRSLCNKLQLEADPQRVQLLKSELAEEFYRETAISHREGGALIRTGAPCFVIVQIP